MPIRDFNKDTDLETIRALLVALQDFERRVYPRLPSGADIVDDYVPHMLDECRTCHGKLIVATVDDQVVGFATILTRVRSPDIQDGGLEYGLVADLVVAEKYRRQGLGRQLLAAAEAHARDQGVQCLRIGVLTGNPSARRLYASMGFTDLYLELEKDLGASR